MRQRRTFFSCVLGLLLLLQSAALATNIETTWGHYRGTCPGHEISFTMNMEGISHMRVDGTEYADVTFMEDGMLATTYSFRIWKRPERWQIQFFVPYRFDGPAQDVAGFYSVTDEDGHTLAHCVLDFTFTHDPD